MEERIKARIAELEQIERERTIELTVIRNLLNELRTLLAPLNTDVPASSAHEDARP